MTIGEVAATIPYENTLIFVSSIALAGATFWYGLLSCWRASQILRRSAHAETATEGARVQLEGTVERHGETVTAPVSGERCVAFSLAAKKSDSDGGTKTVAADHEGVPFVLSTDDADVLVTDIAGFETRFQDDSEMVSADVENLPPDVQQFFAARDADLSGRLGVESVTRYVYEDRLHAGETAFVDGVVHSSVDRGTLSAGVAGAVTPGPTRWYHRLLPDGPWLLADASVAGTARTLLGEGLLFAGFGLATGLAVLWWWFEFEAGGSVWAVFVALAAAGVLALLVGLYLKILAPLLADSK